MLLLSSISDVGFGLFEMLDNLGDAFDNGLALVLEVLFSLALLIIGVLTFGLDILCISFSISS